jgi:crotonobetainyl-CoA:carnitine CoA-transferase CaiB-like acyl-CoA transferase
MSNKPLDGIRVLDLSRLLPGPVASQVLADMGAAVDKLEDIQGGDYLRFMPPHCDGVNAPFMALNRGKRSLALDLKKPSGKATFLKLISRYDVLIESFRPGVMEKLGLGYETLKQVSPKLVYCAITGYGQTGPLAHRAGHDINYLARAGILGLTGPDAGPPQVFGVQLADVAGAMSGVQQILAALLARVSTGQGRFLDVSMCEAAIPYGVFGLMSAAVGDEVAQGGSALAGSIAPFGTYKTKDGRAMALGALEPKFWAAFCTMVGFDPDMSALMAGPHQVALKAQLATLFASRDFAEWKAIAEESDCCLEPVLTPEEVLEDAEHRARGSVREVNGVTLVAVSPGLSEADFEKPAPTQGQQGRAVLTEAGFTAEEVEALLREGVMRIDG